MKQMLQVAHCSADFPDDSIWDDLGQAILQTAGLNMATAVADLLRARGAEVSVPEDHLEHGWEMEAFWQDGEFWLQVTYLDDGAIIMTHDQTYGLIARLMGKKSPYVAFLEVLHEALSADNRFGNIRWQPWIEKLGVAGALSPTSPYPGPELE